MSNTTILFAAQKMCAAFSPVHDAVAKAIKWEIIKIALGEEEDALYSDDKPSQPFDVHAIGVLLDEPGSPEQLIEALDKHYALQLDEGESLADYVCLDRMKAAATLIGHAKQTIWWTLALEKQYGELEKAGRNARDQGDLATLIEVANKVAAVETANSAIAQFSDFRPNEPLKQA
ncbi:hypothetical protein ACT3R7_11965 [Halomonas sp. AOP43-A1-21]